MFDIYGQRIGRINKWLKQREVSCTTRKVWLTGWESACPPSTAGVATNPTRFLRHLWLATVCAGAARTLTHGSNHRWTPDVDGSSSSNNSGTGPVLIDHIGVPLPRGRDNVEDREIREAYSAWLEWNRRTVESIRQQGCTRFTRADYDAAYADGDGVPRTFCGEPFEPLSWEVE